MLHYQEGVRKPSQPRLVQSRGHRTNQACYKSGIFPRIPLIFSVPDGLWDAWC